MVGVFIQQFCGQEIREVIAVGDCKVCFYCGNLLIEHGQQNQIIDLLLLLFGLEDGAVMAAALVDDEATDRAIVAAFHLGFDVVLVAQPLKRPAGDVNSGLTES